MCVHVFLCVCVCVCACVSLCVCVCVCVYRWVSGDKKYILLLLHFLLVCLFQLNKLTP